MEEELQMILIEEFLLLILMNIWETFYLIKTKNFSFQWLRSIIIHCQAKWTMKVFWHILMKFRLLLPLKYLDFIQMLKLLISVMLLNYYGVIWYLCSLLMEELMLELIKKNMYTRLQMIFKIKCLWSLMFFSWEKKLDWRYLLPQLYCFKS